MGNNPEIRSQSVRPTASFGKIFLSSGITIAALAWMFQMQGRTYRESYLGYFNLDSRNFPLSASDHLWLTLLGWSELSIKMFSELGDAYITILTQHGPLVFAILLASYWTGKYLLSRPRALSKPAQSLKNKQPLRPLGWATTKAKEIAFAVGITVGGFWWAPAILLVGSFGFRLGFIVLFIPFDTLGKKAAVSFCSKDEKALSRVYFSGASSETEWAYLIECNTDFCAVMRDRKVSVIPAAQFKYIDVAPSYRSTTPAEKPQAQNSSFCPISS